MGLEERLQQATDGIYTDMHANSGFSQISSISGKILDDLQAENPDGFMSPEHIALMSDDEIADLQGMVSQMITETQYQAGYYANQLFEGGQYQPPGADGLDKGRIQLELDTYGKFEGMAIIDGLKDTLSDPDADIETVKAYLQQQVDELTALTGDAITDGVELKERLAEMTEELAVGGIATIAEFRDELSEMPDFVKEHVVEAVEERLDEIVGDPAEEQNFLNTLKEQIGYTEDHAAAAPAAALTLDVSPT